MGCYLCAIVNLNFTAMKTTTSTTRPPRFDKQWSQTIIDNLDKADGEAFAEAIRRYQLDGTEPDLPPGLAVAFEFLRPTIDRRARAREKARQRRERNQSAIAKEAKSAIQATEASALEIGHNSAIPGEDDWEARQKYWTDFVNSRTSPLTQAEIENGRFAYETDTWAQDRDDTGPMRPDGTTLSYDERLRHYVNLLRDDHPTLVRIADEIARLSKVLYRSGDLRNHLGAFINHATVQPIPDLDKAAFRRAFTGYMLRCAYNYRNAINVTKA